MKYTLTASPANKQAMAMRHRFFFRDSDQEGCYDIPGHLEYMREEGLTELRLCLAIRETNSEYFFCKHFGEVGKKEFCGWWCKGYTPRNGKGGVCKQWGYTYCPTDKEFLLSLDFCCQSCGKLGGTKELHACPTAAHIDDDESETCNCCAECVRQCEMDV